MKRKIIYLLIIIFILLQISACKELEEIVEDNIGNMLAGSSGSEVEKFYAFLDRDPNFDPDNKKILVKRAGIVFENDGKSIDRMGLDSDYFYNGFHSYIEDEEGQLMGVDEDTLCQMYFYFEDEPYEFVNIDRLLSELPDDEYGNFFVEIELEGDYIKYIKEKKPSELMAENYKTKASDVINNGGIFVKYEDIVYYREYSEDSFMDSNIWGEDRINLNGLSRIKKLYPNGKTEEIWSGQGHFGLFIYKDKAGKPRILSSKKHGNDTWQEGYEMRMDIFSMDLDGNILGDYGRGNIFAIDEERQVAIITNGSEGILILDLENGKRDLVEGEGFEPIHYDEEDGVIYYHELYKMNYDDIEIFAKTLGGESKKIFSATRDELEDLIHDGYLGQHNFYRTFRPSGDYLFVHIEAREGSGDMFCGNLPLKIRKDRSGYESIGHYREVDWYGLDKVFIYRNDPPFYYESYGYNVFNQDNLKYPIMVLSEEDLESVGLSTNPFYGDERLLLIEDLHYIDGDTFFTVKGGDRDEEEDIGWRMAYKNLEWEVYVFRGESGTIEFLYKH